MFIFRRIAALILDLFIFWACYKACSNRWSHYLADRANGIVLPYVLQFFAIGAFGIGAIICIYIYLTA
jgi:hypothetical protein